MSAINYKAKYLKYKSKYLKLKEEISGGLKPPSDNYPNETSSSPTVDPDIEPDYENTQVSPYNININEDIMSSLPEPIPATYKYNINRHNNGICSVIGYLSPNGVDLLLRITYLNSSNNSISKKWVNSKDVSIGSTFVNNGLENENSWAKFLFGNETTF